MKRYLFLGSLIVSIAAGLLLLPNHRVVAQDYKAYPMWNSSLPLEQRVTDLVGRLTLEEKVAQMMNNAPAIPRFGILPFEWWNEILHGVARSPYKVTVFPQAIAMAATWDTSALKLMAQYAGMEGRAINNMAIVEGKTGEYYRGVTFWTPNINIFRDPRWGRGQETYGEDPFLTAKLGAAFVRGLQGDDPNYMLAAACAKHYAVHSGPEATRHSDNVKPSLYDLRDTYLPAFRELVVNAKVAGVMCAYNALNDQPCCANDLIMTEILRREWNFTGYVTSDCGAMDDFVRNHKTHKNDQLAAADGVFHGTDVDCGSVVYRTLVDAVKNGIISEKQIDVSLKRLFTIRYRLGLFDPAEKVKYRQVAPYVLEAPEHRDHALKMAHESIVLLKNDKGLLPLSKSIRKIAVIGPNADSKTALLGNYNGFPSRIVTILDGIREKLGPGFGIVYEPATGLTIDSVQGPASGRGGEKGKYHSVDKAALLARISDVDAIVYVGGISPELEGEEMSVNAEGFSDGDRTSILLPRVQTNMLKLLKTSGKPMVFVLLTGSAIALPWEHENIPAIVNAWYGGQSAGTAVADVLFGDYNPAGRLPVTFYASDADLPSMNNYNMEGRTYRYFKGKPLYPFGYGLSYTTFAYTGLEAPAAARKGEKVMISATVTNTGTMDGEEVVQLYVSYPGLARRAPIRALKGFQRISLKMGESRQVSFELDPAQLMLVDEQGVSYQPSGKLVFSIGGGQPQDGHVKHGAGPKTIQGSMVIMDK